MYTKLKLSLVAEIRFSLYARSWWRANGSAGSAAHREESIGVVHGWVGGRDFPRDWRNDVQYPRGSWNKRGRVDVDVDGSSLIAVQMFVVISTFEVRSRPAKPCWRAPLCRVWTSTSIWFEDMHEDEGMAMGWMEWMDGRAGGRTRSHPVIYTKAAVSEVSSSLSGIRGRTLLVSLILHSRGTTVQTSIRCVCKVNYGRRRPDAAGWKQMRVAMRLWPAQGSGHQAYELATWPVVSRDQMQFDRRRADRITFHWPRSKAGSH